MSEKNPGWPAVLRHERVELRPFRRSDAAEWSQVRRANDDWQARWEPPPGSSWQQSNSPAGFKALYKDFRNVGKRGTAWPFAVCYDGRLVGGITVGNIVRRAFCSASVGYWIDHAHAGRNITPTALALVCDHAFWPGALHRIEVNIQPHNHPSRRVVEKLGFRREAEYRRYLYIYGEWRDHIGYGLTVEDVAEYGGLLARWTSEK